MKLQIDSGYLVPDPADPHRWMLIAYVEDHDMVYVFRRCEESSVKPIETTEKKGEE